MWKVITTKRAAYVAAALALSLAALCNACERGEMKREGCFDAADGKRVCNEPAYAPEPDGPPRTEDR